MMILIGGFYHAVYTGLGFASKIAEEPARQTMLMQVSTLPNTISYPMYASGLVGTALVYWLALWKKTLFPQVVPDFSSNDSMDGPLRISQILPNDSCSCRRDHLRRVDQWIVCAVLRHCHLCLLAARRARTAAGRSREARTPKHA
jgi:hypothetical protein